MSLTILIRNLRIRHHFLTQMVSLGMSQEDTLATSKRLVLVGYREVFEISIRQRILVAKDNSSNPLASQTILALRTLLTLVDSIPVLNSISKPPKRNASVLDKVIDNVFRQPSPIGILQCERSVPMVKRCHWDDVVLDAGVDEIVVMCNGFFIYCSPSEGEDTTPG